MKAKPNKSESQHVPVIIGNYAPFRLVLRDTDVWSPTLEDINARNYDYVKLCRLSCFINIGIEPFSLGVGFDGSIVLPASPDFRTRESALDKFNETLGIILLGGIYSEAVQPTDISFGTLFFDGYLKQHNGGTGHEASFHKAIQTKHVGNLDVISLLEPTTITNTQLEEAYKKGKEYFSKLDKLSPSLLLNGTSNYVKNQWGEGLIFLWTSIEQVVNIIWVKEIIQEEKENEELIEGRNKFLKDFRSWTTSTKIEVLYQKGFLKTKQYKLLNIARKSRNDFVHNGKELTQENVRSALDGLFHIMSLVITSYQNPELLNDTLETIYKNQRGDLIPKKTRFSKEEVTHWLPVPPLPGDTNWKKKKYEIIEALVLKPMNSPGNKETLKYHGKK